MLYNLRKVAISRGANSKVVIVHTTATIKKTIISLSFVAIQFTVRMYSNLA